MNRLISILLGIFIATNAWSIGIYSYPGNGYGSLMHKATSRDGVTVGIKNDILELENNTTSDYCLVDSTTLPADFTYSVKIANGNNRRGKSVKSLNADGKVSKTHLQRWGVAIDMMPNGDMITVELRCDNGDAYNDVADNRMLEILVAKHTAASTTVIKSLKVNKDVDLYNGDNILSVNAYGDDIKVLVGRKTPKTVLETTVKREAANSRVGILAGPGSSVKVKRTMLNYEKDNRVAKHTDWTKKTLTEHFRNSTDPAEGFWVYLDRDMEEKMARMGGRYTIATVKNKDNGYDIIYCDGATVNDSQWTPYMIKGSMKKTIFTSNYDATWIDSNFTPLSKDIQATIENAVILTIKFPVLKSQLRFSKVIETDD